MFQTSLVLLRAPKSRRISPWTKARTRYLRRRWAQGARVRDIAAELGHGITPNAVIAKIHRLGIADLSPFGGAPGRRYAAKTIRRVDKVASGYRAAYWYRKGAAAGLGGERQALCRECAPRREHPAPPAPRAS